VRIKIAPAWVTCLDQRQLALARACLDLLLPQDRALHDVVPLVPHQKPAAIALGEARLQSLTMLPRSAQEVRGDADLQGAIAPACHDVNSRLLLLLHARIAP